MGLAGRMPQGHQMTHHHLGMEWEELSVSCKSQPYPVEDNLAGVLADLTRELVAGSDMGDKGLVLIGDREGVSGGFHGVGVDMRQIG